MQDFLFHHSSLIVHHYFSFLSFVWGACIGSFLNVCIYRIPKDLSIVKPRSFCPHCNRQIPWYLNIPLVSYLILGAKCRYCGGKISFRYFLVELLTAVLFLLVWLKFSPQGVNTPLYLVPVSDWRLIPVYWLVIYGLILGTFVDFEHMIIPDRVTLGGIVAGITISAILPSLHGETTVIRSLMWSSIAMASGAATLWMLGVIGKLIFKKDAMGFGDVKLIGAIGAFTGTTSVFFTIIISSFLGSIAGILLVLFGRKKMQSRIPYGPYIALAAIIWILWGNTIWNAYINFLMPAEPFIR